MAKSSPLPVVTESARAPTVPEKLFLDCVHCGLCLSACPTYLELGNEADSPRGRIYLMRATAERRTTLDADVTRHLNLCLDCRACESACPSGVQYGRLVEPFRMAIAQSGVQRFSKLQRFALFHVLTQPRRLRLGLLPARVLQSAGLDRFLEIPWISKMVPESLGQMLALLPRLQGRQRGLSEMLTPHGKQRARVALFSGCVADGIFPETTRATARVLQWNGCEVWVPRRQGCCGALHFHAGDEEGARRLAVANARSFAQTFRRKKIDALIVNAAGCGAMLKDYGRLLEGTPAAADGAALASKAKDVSEFLMDLGPVPPRHPLPVRATYHDACHLAHAQKIRRQPRQLLEMIPGLELVPLDESEVCCGAAGTYSLTEPEMADRLGARKAERIIATGAKAVFAGNVGCLLQIGRHLKTQHADIWVGHPVDALAASYNGRDRTHR